MTVMTQEAEINQLREAMSAFIGERLKNKIEKLDDDLRGGSIAQDSYEQRKHELEQQYAPGAWLADHADKASQIRIVTHVSKITHPHASPESSVRARLLAISDNWCDSSSLPVLDDVVGNAAVGYLAAFVNTVAVNHKTVAERMRDRDALLAKALDFDEATAAEVFAAFDVLAHSPPTEAARVKQVYFLLGDGAYHLLAPLHASSIATVLTELTGYDEARNELYRVQRDARKKEVFYESPLPDYVNITNLMLGSGKPQNISVGTNRRRGVTALLASVPPTWQRTQVRMPMRITSVFVRAFPYIARNAIRRLSVFLLKDGVNNIAARNRRASYFDDIVDELLMFAAELQGTEPGWTADKSCQLSRDEQLWLDPERAQLDARFAHDYENLDWASDVARSFSSWLNLELRKLKVPLGSRERAVWFKAALHALRHVDADSEPVEFEEEQAQ